MRANMTIVGLSFKTETRLPECEASASAAVPPPAASAAWAVKPVSGMNFIIMIMDAQRAQPLPRNMSPGALWKRKPAARGPSEKPMLLPQ